MAFLRSSITQDAVGIVRGRGVWLRPPMMSDYAPWAELRARSREHLTPWEPAWPRDDLSRSAFRRRMRHYQREAREDLGYAFLIFRDTDESSSAALTLSNVRRGVTQAAMLGYWLGLPSWAGLHDRGRARAVAAFAFDELRLHRLEAATMPSNAASIRVLERNGFRARGPRAAAISRSTARGRTTCCSGSCPRNSRARPVAGGARSMIAARASGRTGLARARGDGSVLALLVRAVCARRASRTPALALKPIVVDPDQDRIEITTLGELYEGRGDSLQVETAAGADGMTGRMSVTAATPGTNPNWIVFALSNPTDKPIERWLTADRYNVIGSGAVWPDLDARRIEAVTPSIGFVPERIKSDRADIFRITLEPGQTITYVAELSSERFARIYLWKPLDYELKISRPAAVQRHHAWA